jgi:hypothetical protein
MCFGSIAYNSIPVSIAVILKNAKMYLSIFFDWNKADAAEKRTM